jgi:hypothetical protein
MKTSTFERALAQNANMTPLRGESLGFSVKSNPHCHCYHNLKGTLKVNPHCTVHGTAAKTNNPSHTKHFMSPLSGSTAYKGGGVAAGLALGTKIAYDYYRGNPMDNYAVYGATALFGYAAAGILGWEGLP